MAQWVNRLRNNIFVNPPPLPLSCEISRALHLAQLGLTAGRQAVRLVSRSQTAFFLIYRDDILEKSGLATRDYCQAGRQAGRQTKYR